jgi:hypothetical protein
MSTTEFLKISLPDSVMDSITLVNTFNDLVDKFNNHNHTIYKGAPLTTNAINITTKVNFNDYEIRNINYICLYPNNNVEGSFNSIYIKNGSLYLRTADGQAVQITKNGVFNSALAGGIGGDYGESEGNIVYTSEDNTYTFYLSDDLSQIRVRNLILNNIFTLKKEPNSSNYTLTLPTNLPIATSILTVDGNGEIKYYYSESIGYLTGDNNTIVALPIDLNSLQVDTVNLLKGVQYNLNGILSSSVNSAVLIPSNYLETLPNGAVYYNTVNQNFGYKVNGVWRYTADVEHSLLRLDSIIDVSLSSTMVIDYVEVDPEDPDTPLDRVISWEEKPLEHGDFLGYVDGLWRPMSNFLHTPQTIANFPQDLTDIGIHNLSELSDINTMLALSSSGLLGYYGGVLGLKLPIAPVVNWTAVNSVGIENQIDLMDYINSLPNTEDQVNVFNGYIGKATTDSLNNLLDVTGVIDSSYILKAVVVEGSVNYTPYSIEGTPSPLTSKGDIWIGGGDDVDVIDDRFPVGDDGKALALVNNEGIISLEWVDPPVMDITPGWYEAYRFNNTFTTTSYGHYYPEYKDYKIKLKRSSLAPLKSVVDYPSFELVLSTGGGTSNIINGINFSNLDTQLTPTVTFTCDVPDFYRISIHRDPLKEEVLTTIQPPGVYKTVGTSSRNLDKLYCIVYIPLGKGKRAIFFSFLINCSEDPYDPSNEEIRYTITYTGTTGGGFGALSTKVRFYNIPDLGEDYTLTYTHDGYNIFHNPSGTIWRQIATSISPDPAGFTTIHDTDLDGTLNISTINFNIQGNDQPTYIKNITFNDENINVSNFSALSPLKLTASSLDIEDLSNPFSITDPSLRCDLSIALSNIETPYTLATVDITNTVYVSKLRYNSSDYNAGFKFYTINITNTPNNTFTTNVSNTFIIATIYYTSPPPGGEIPDILLPDYEQIFDMELDTTGNFLIVVGNIVRIYRLTTPFDVSTIYLLNDGSEYSYQPLLNWTGSHPLASCKMTTDLSFSPDGMKVIKYRGGNIQIFSCSSPFNTDNLTFLSECSTSIFIDLLTNNITLDEIGSDVYCTPLLTSIQCITITNEGDYLGIVGNSNLSYSRITDTGSYDRVSVGYTGAIYIKLHNPSDLLTAKIDQHLTLTSTTGVVNTSGSFVSIGGDNPRQILTGARTAVSHISSKYRNTLYRFLYGSLVNSENPPLLLYKIIPFNNRIVCKHCNMSDSPLPVNINKASMLEFYPVKLTTVTSGTATTYCSYLGNTLLVKPPGIVDGANYTIRVTLKVPEDILSLDSILIMYTGILTNMYTSLITPILPEGNTYNNVLVNGYDFQYKPLFAYNGYRYSILIHHSTPSSEGVYQLATAWVTEPFAPSSTYHITLSDFTLPNANVQGLVQDSFFSDDGLYFGFRGRSNVEGTGYIIYHCTLSTPFLPSTCVEYWVEDLQIAGRRGGGFLDGYFLNDGMYYLSIGRSLYRDVGNRDYLVPPILYNRDSLDTYITLFKLKRPYMLSREAAGWNIFKGVASELFAGNLFNSVEVYMLSASSIQVRDIKLYGGILLPISLSTPYGNINGFLGVQTRSVNIDDILYVTIEGEQNTIDEEV